MPYAQRLPNAKKADRRCGSFSRHGHLIIALRKPTQLSATDWIGEAIGQRSALLSVRASAPPA